MNGTVAFLLAETVSTNPAVEIAKNFHWSPALFFAQLVTFCLVAFLLKKFAYRPVIEMLEQRKQRIAQSEENIEKIKRELADAESKSREIIDSANNQAEKMINEAIESAQVAGEKKRQESIREAQEIIEKAQEATKLEREEILRDLRKDFGRLVVETTRKVTGKVLTDEDQQKINQETMSQITS